MPHVKTCDEQKAACNNLVSSVSEGSQKKKVHTEVLSQPTNTKEMLNKLNLDQNVRWKDVVLKKKIGEGEFGDVWQGMYFDFEVAVKIIKMKNEMSTSEVRKAIEEISVMAKLKHPNVVLLMGACLNDDNQLVIITEFASRGDLRTALTNCPELQSLPLRLKIGLGIATGLHWLASHGIVHRDLKLPNLLVFDDWTVKVGDFGLSLQIKEGHTVNSFGGNIKYSAPEILKVRFDESIRQSVYAYSEKTDVYSFGLLFWEIFTLKALYIRPREYSGKKGLAKYVLEGNRPLLERLWSPKLRDVLSACWNQDPKLRPTFQTIVDLWPDLTTHILCPDQNGRKLVAQLWPKGTEENKIPFQEFEDVFYKICVNKTTNISNKKQHSYSKLLSVILCDPFDDVVSKTRFCNLVGWFGPIDVENQCKDFFGRIKDLLTKKFFHGFLSSKNAMTRLKTCYDTKKLQFYVVRFSEADVGGFHLTFIEDDGKVTHERITNRNGKWFVENLMEEYDSWKRVIANCKSVWHLKKSLPDSPYPAALKNML
eukprot:TRINITY_DN13508_c0_g1_i12.p1 TRINITY_DN13508_c0_g1~~TRINITY_DN13508_c0_g1_i12.p1  ORF type:complete len:538 (-),score=117.89 TRINITY_DN13508_c0_g1_i12:198-1811(-)